LFIFEFFDHYFVRFWFFFFVDDYFFLFFNFVFVYFWVLRPLLRKFLIFLCRWLFLCIFQLRFCLFFGYSNTTWSGFVFFCFYIFFVDCFFLGYAFTNKEDWRSLRVQRSGFGYAFTIYCFYIFLFLIYVVHCLCLYAFNGHHAINQSDEELSKSFDVQNQDWKR